MNVSLTNTSFLTRTNHGFLFKWGSWVPMHVRHLFKQRMAFCLAHLSVSCLRMWTLFASSERRYQKPITRDCIELRKRVEQQLTRTLALYAQDKQSNRVLK